MTNESDLYRQSRRYHAAKAQFHRWFQLYERPRTPELVERQLQMFADRFEIVTAGGATVRTREGYRNGIGRYGSEDRHGHRVQRVTVEEFGFHFLSLQADVLYQYRGAAGAVTGAHVSYECELTGSADFEPLFTRLRITPVGSTSGGEFIDTYPANRALALVYRWLSLVEEPSLGVGPFSELLAPDNEFSLRFGSAPITDRRAVAAWLQASSQRVATSRHTVAAFSATETEPGKYMVSMDFDWHGTDAGDHPRSGRVHHEWTLVDTGERYCRILQAQATPIIPISRARQST
ncbi:hypothetical protein [Streptomyces sp. NPDC096030]|uniref:hypothetical protein n=1 Tax=Streptomyces sp. NPDC096030 TaxID=3155423 RepID=UPI0033234159